MSIIDSIESVLITPQRYIDSFQLYTTFEEQHDDDLAITNHPVQQGAAITDHSFKLPSRVRLRIGYSDSGLEALTYGPGYSKEAYAQMLALQASREPFSISTGKRLYDNMLIESLSTYTDATTENALILTVVCRQVIIVSVSTTKLQAEKQADPSATAATTNSGTKTATETSASIIYRGASLFHP